MAKEDNTVKELIQKLSAELLRLRSESPESIKSIIQKANFESFLSKDELNFLREFWKKYSSESPVNQHMHVNLNDLLYKHKDEVNTSGFNHEELMQSLVYIPPVILTKLITN